MKFQIYRSLDYKPNYEKMLGAYPVLANYGFKTDELGNGYVTITFLKQLMQLVKEIGIGIILFPNENSIEIYDDYRE